MSRSPRGSLSVGDPARYDLAVVVICSVTPSSDFAYAPPMVRRGSGAGRSVPSKRALTSRKRLRCDFYRLHGIAGATLRERLLAIQAMESGDRAKEIHGNDVRLQRFAELPSGLIEADIVLVVYHGDVPVLTTREGEEAPIKLEDGQGFGYGTALIFDPASGLLLLQRSQHSITAFDVSLYIQKCHTRPIDEYEFTPIMQRDKAEELERWDRITAIDLQVSGVATNLFHEARTALGEAFTDPDAPGAETIRVYLANQRGLEKSWARRWWEYIERAAASAKGGTLDFGETRIVGKLKASRASQVLRLLDLQLGGSADIKIGPERYMTFESRISVMREIWGNLCAQAKGNGGQGP